MSQRWWQMWKEYTGYDASITDALAAMVIIPAPLSAASCVSCPCCITLCPRSASAMSHLLPASAARVWVSHDRRAVAVFIVQQSSARGLARSITRISWIRFTGCLPSNATFLASRGPPYFRINPRATRTPLCPRSPPCSALCHACPQAAWKLLWEWYGGGPTVTRVMRVCHLSCTLFSTPPASPGRRQRKAR